MASIGLPQNFNEDVGNWDVSNVSNMRGMFYGAGLYSNFWCRYGLDKWDTSKFNWVEDQNFWTKDFEPLLPNINHLILAGGEPMYLKPVSYTHLTLPTKRIV